MQAIQTKYIPATNTKPSRIKAQCEAGTLVVSWEYGLNIGDNHKRACDLLLGKLKWDYNFVSGQLKDGSYGHVLTTNKGRSL